MNNNRKRIYLEHYYLTGGNELPFATFRGQVVRVMPNAYIIKHLYIRFTNMDGTVTEGKEDHIWLFDVEPLIKADVKLYDCIEFTSLAYLYRRKNNVCDFSIKDIEDVEKIDKYSLPTDEYLQKQYIEDLICETCIYNEYCSPVVCLMNEEYKINLKANLITFSIIREIEPQLKKMKSEEEQNEFIRKYVEKLKEKGDWRVIANKNV